jgi:hypothetical protein
MNAFALTLTAELSSYRAYSSAVTVFERAISLLDLPVSPVY